MVELIWEGKYDRDGKRVAPLRVTLPFQTVETINESAQLRQRALDLFSSGRDPEWRNRLIWGDKKYVLPSLLPEFAGQVDLIYIDPPFATGADFSFQARVGDEAFTKEPSMIEQKAYRDTWGRGLDSYLQWFYETVVLLGELLNESGAFFVHLDWHLAHYAKVVLDHVLGADNFRNEIIVKRPISKNLQAQFKEIASLSAGHDTLFWYSKSPTQRFRPIYTAMETKSPEGYWHHFWSNADRPTMRYELLGVTPANGQWKWSKERALMAVENYNTFLRSGRGKSLVEHWQETGEDLEFIRLSSTGKVENWFPPATEKLADTLWTDVPSYENQKMYATQKHEALLERIIKASSNEGGLVLDCFCGSGTTAAVAEKLGRRWLTCDLGRFAIHTTRKRLLAIENVRPFVVQNLGKYERQVWQRAEFGARAEQVVDTYRRFILDLYHAEPLAGYTWLHGKKGGRLVHVGTVETPITAADVQQMAIEFRRLVGAGEDLPRQAGIDVLGWDFALELNETARQVAQEAGLSVRFVRIPREVLEKKAVEQGDIAFFELAALAVEATVRRRTVTIALTDFMVPPDDVPADVIRAVKKWSEWIDYWAVDFDYRDDTFHNEWQSYRTRKERGLQLRVTHEYDRPGCYTVVVKAIDILGNDTTKALTVTIPA